MSVNMEQNDPFEKRPQLMSIRQRKIIFSPLRLVAIILASILVTETVVMTLLGKYAKLSMMAEVAIDASILTIALFPVLYFYLFRPLIGLISECRQNEEQLKSYHEHLEEVVQQRTAQLESMYRSLKEENEESRRAKLALFESEERFRQIFEQSEDAIVLFRPGDGSIIDANPTAVRIFCKSRQELMDGGLSALCNKEGYNLLNAVITQIARDDAPGIIEKFECTVSPGETRILSFHGKKINLQGSEIVYTTFRDISTRIRLENEAREIQARLIQANRMTTLGTLVSSVAHEINNPNNFLLMNAGIIKQAWKDIAPVIEAHVAREGDFAVARSTWDEARSFLPEAIEGIQQGASRINSIVDILKDIGRDDRFQLESSADVNAVVQLSVSILNQLISKATSRFQLELADGLPQVWGSARQLEQVVINLIQNALQALPDQNHAVRVSSGIDPDTGQILIRVMDEGVGIPPEVADRVMEPFFTTRLDHGGTGLGLAISSTIVKAYGGTMDFCSEPGRGTTFTVRLCRAKVNGNNGGNGEVNNDNS